MDSGIIAAPGEMITAGGTRFHVQRYAGTAPRTFILEAGLTMMSSCWGWIAPELQKLGTVLAYDRAGLGWSDEREGLRDARQIGAELGALLKAMELRGEIVLVGHSMGAFYNLAFMQQHPGIISSLIWLDPTHPDQLPRSRRMQSFFFFLEFAHLLAARNLPSITLRIVPHLKGLPELDFAAVKSFLKNPRHLKTTAREARAWKLSADYVREINLNNQPLLIVSAQKSALRRWAEFQKEMAQRSSKTRHVTFTDVSHLSMLANREHARRVAREISTFVEEM